LKNFKKFNLSKIPKFFLKKLTKSYLSTTNTSVGFKDIRVVVKGLSLTKESISPTKYPSLISESFYSSQSLNLTAPSLIKIPNLASSPFVHISLLVSNLF
jgi:hypothetical protein